MCVIRTVRGDGGGELSHLMVALSSRPFSSTAAIWGTRAQRQALGATLWASGRSAAPGAPSSGVSSDRLAVGQRTSVSRPPSQPGGPGDAGVSGEPRTSVITPIRSMSRAGLRGSSLGVECPLGGEDDAREEAVAEAVMEAP